MLRRWAIRAGTLCVGFLLLATWFRVSSREVNVKPQDPRHATEDLIYETAMPTRANPGRIIKSAAAIIGALATLVFAYLAVAISAHWFPWEQAKIPSIAMDLEPGQSHASRYSAINTLTNFLTSNYTNVTRLNVTLTGFKPTGSDSHAMSDLVNTPQSIDVLYKGAGSSSTITTVYLGAGCRNSVSVCGILILDLVSGPGSNLGYVTQDAAATISIFGYYQIGAVACQTGTCSINLIPVEPPN
jgi:hypothetical protein